MAEYDAVRKEAFGKKMVDILNSGALNLAMAVGYRQKLFDTMENIGVPSSVDAIALKSGLQPRYIKEWLGVMVTGGVVEISSDTSSVFLYHLPPEHAVFLTRNAGNNNLGVYTQEIPLLTQCAMEAVVDGFNTGQGVPFSCYPRFQAFMAELSNAKHRQILVEQFLPQVDEGRLIQRLERGIDVCDLGCGEGVALNLMARAFPKSRFWGVDNHAQALGIAGKEAKKTGLNNVTYHLADAAYLADEPRFAKKFDYICAFDAIHDQSKPLEALKSIHAMLAVDGIFSMVDIAAQSHHAGNMDHPMGPFLYTVSLMHCMPVGLNDNGAGLGMMWGRQQAEELLKEAGFDRVVVQEMDHDAFNLHYMCRVKGFC
ncbi:Methyltransferase domain-containing protein [Desulfocicer vacuolatum DSM 3385]|uniref:Methyltransferase domain-containing protein n=1 Tax=Desulfocicer vacuolatum DSM 3385 TaxID=1121400 RepID=A0A1W2EDR4_9BACT|nr:class I SAM-dependent methyltransferase [Desulfocicer vacuolatum]SMD07532.1 Methyltransferase domain-containing protein [Desulfocicer vacuolatum DSM 3385]